MYGTLRAQVFSACHAKYMPNDVARPFSQACMNDMNEADNGPERTSF